MKKILFFDTSIGTLNIGDEIINEAIARESEKIFSEDYILKLPTRTNVLNHFQILYNKSFKENFGAADLKFICGTNLLYKNMLRPMPNWNINILNTSIQKNSILFGVGSGNNSKKTTLYTKFLYKKVLSHDYIHSVRDQATKRMLEEIGLKAIVTGCPTLWELTPEVCRSIPTTKNNCAIFTLTHYRSFRNYNEDKEMVKIIKENYSNVYFWPQSLGDLTYLNELNEAENVNILPPNLNAFDQFLKTHECDYIGTRLHGGIFSLQHGRRSIILAIDNRAREIKKNNHIPCIERDETSLSLQGLINSKWDTNITVEVEKIEKWKKQFN
ncbi:polysaccharide pyruvyl transferase family protein [Enterococcus mundtii]|nr:polysaccharide pyruvyl transferase family protein [Enterococcus mundtii]NBA62428.1 polysaccharide pyruvyl transferase family protein [Enterococcus mundtii]SFM17580.1 Polysaccharide pyruvyl transferase [Enterococcus mundtii]